MIVSVNNVFAAAPLWTCHRAAGGLAVTFTTPSGSLVYNLGTPVPPTIVVSDITTTSTHLYTCRFNCTVSPIWMCLFAAFELATVKAFCLYLRSIQSSIPSSAVALINMTNTLLYSPFGQACEFAIIDNITFADQTNGQVILQILYDVYHNTRMYNSWVRHGLKTGGPKPLAWPYKGCEFDKKF